MGEGVRAATCLEPRQPARYEREWHGDNASSMLIARGNAPRVQLDQLQKIRLRRTELAWHLSAYAPQGRLQLAARQMPRQRKPRVRALGRGCFRREPKAPCLADG